MDHLTPLSFRYAPWDKRGALRGIKEERPESRDLLTLFWDSPIPTIGDADFHQHDSLVWFGGL